RQNSDNEKSRRPAQSPEAKTRILHQAVDEIAAQRFPAFFFEPLMTSELEPGATLGLDTIYSGTFQVGNAVLDVRAKLFVQVVVRFSTVDKFRGERSKIGTHALSGSAAITVAMAAARRFHHSVSSRRRFRPLRVSS